MTSRLLPPVNDFSLRAMAVPDEISLNVNSLEPVILLEVPMATAVTFASVLPNVIDPTFSLADATSVSASRVNCREPVVIIVPF